MDAEHDKLHVNRGLSSSSRAECLVKVKVDNILRRPTSRAWRSFLSPEYRTEVPEGTRWPAKFHPWHWSDVASRQRKLIHNHTATPDACLCRVRLGCVNWIPDNSRLSPTENLQHEHVRSNRPHRHTRHDTDRTVLSRLVWRCEPSPPDKCVQHQRRHCRCDRWTHSDAERTCRAASIHTATPLSRLPVDRRRDAGQAGSYA